MITLAKIFGVLGVVAYALGSYYIFIVTRLGTNPYWATDYGWLWHLLTTLGAAIFSIVAVFQKKPRKTLRWLLASIGLWVAGQIPHVIWLAPPDPVKALIGFGIFSIFTFPAIIASLFAWLGSWFASRSS